jgi:hypothetical protein
MAARADSINDSATGRAARRIDVSGRVTSPTKEKPARPSISR